MNSIFGGSLAGARIAVGFFYAGLLSLTVLSHTLTAAPLGAASGEPAPGVPGGVFASIGGGAVYSPSINNSGQTAFIASLVHAAGVDNTNDVGIWTSANGVLSFVAREGDQAPGTANGTKFIYPSDPVNSDGGTAFHSYLDRGDDTIEVFLDSGIWVHRNGSLQLVAQGTMQAPGTVSGTQFYGFSDPTINAAGRVAFGAGLIGGDADANNNGGIWSDRNGPLQIVMRAGDQAPGTPVGTRFAGPNAPVMNSAGQLAFFAQLKDGTGDAAPGRDVGIWSDVSGSLALVARMGGAAPDLPAGATIGGFDNGPIINSQGHLVLATYLNVGPGGVTYDNSHAIYSDRSGALHLVVRSGEQAPDTPAGATFSGFSDVGFNNQNQIVFAAILQNYSGGVTEDNQSGVWIERDGALKLIARQGDPAPGIASGAVFRGFGGGYYTPMLNGAGRVAFLAPLRIGVGGVTDANNQGIWVEDAANHLQLLLREGDTFDVDAGPSVDLRTIDELYMRSYGNDDDGYLRSFNSSGQVAFYATFTDGSSGAFVAQLQTVPEPSAFALSLFAAIAYWRKVAVRRRSS